jgi:hypothetical protein
MKHFYLRSATGFPVACIASAIWRNGNLTDGPIEPDSCMVAFAMSVHNPRDPFDRDLARRIACARLTKGNYLTIAPTQPIKVAILRRIVDDNCILSHPKRKANPFAGRTIGEWVPAPQRVRDAAAHWLTLFDEARFAKKVEDYLQSTKVAEEMCQSDPALEEAEWRNIPDSDEAKLDRIFAEEEPPCP